MNELLTRTQKRGSIIFLRFFVNLIWAPSTGESRAPPRQTLKLSIGDLLRDAMKPRAPYSSLLWPLALSSPHLNRRRRCFSHLTQLQSLLATASPAKRIYATALAALAPSDRVVAAMAHLLCYVWLTQNGLPNYPQVEPKLTQKINGSALHGTCTIFYFLGIG
jgi:hypothetical protein